ncbi:MAG: cold shock domain-containing protein [Bacteroidales bacterium]|nr:cold shock domain-containing protein [Bacteroidales bacterium]
MSRAKETSGKKEVRNKQLKKRKEKAQRKLERKENGKNSFDDMLAWVDEYGRICSAPPTSENKSEVKAENIEISVPKGGKIKKETIIKGKILNFDAARGFGFINSMQLYDSVFFHINDCSAEVKPGDKVEFETEKGLKGIKAVNIKKVS